MSVITEKSLRELVRDASRVREFLNDPVITDIFSGLKHALFNRFVEALDAPTREALHAEARAVEDIEASLRAIVGAGESAQHELAKSEKKALTP